MKLWDTDIKRHIAMWSTRLGHLNWWPKYVYHFTDIHNSAFSSEQRDKIIFHRNAEVLIPSSLPLEPALKFIACRSTAEWQTLLHLLPVDLHQQWIPYIRLGEQGLFERKWTYIEDVVIVDDKMNFR
ncbi:hypothetical protein L0337_35070 [candidate division KSB1 bacterium]|nr:hypothetical protein [candidate division KSB1 bacterium]